MIEGPARSTFLDTLAVYLKPRVLIVLFLGFSAGLPLALSGSTLLFWAAEVGVNLKTIGLFALVGTPYTLKFLWAPIVDALDVPILARFLGRRRGWLLLTQIVLMAAILFLGVNDPASAPGVVALGALMVAAASAVRVLVIDWTLIGASPPTSTRPTRIFRLLRRWIARQGRREVWSCSVMTVGKIGGSGPEPKRSMGRACARRDRGGIGGRCRGRFLRCWRRGERRGRHRRGRRRGRGGGLCQLGEQNLRRRQHAFGAAAHEHLEVIGLGHVGHQPA